MPGIDGSKCACGREVYPPRRYCPDCQRPMAGAQLAARGVVETWTTIEVPPEGFDPPVHVALVRISPGAPGRPAVRVLARVERAVEAGETVALRSAGDVLWALPP